MVCPSPPGSRWPISCSGRAAVTACFFGEGAVAEGEFHETMNLAALWKLPVLFCCENNLYAMGTALARSESETNLAYKAAAYEMPAWSVDGMDVLAVAEATARAVTEIRGGGGPVFLELQTYRFRAHSMYDPDRYRSKEEIEHWRERDPIDLLKARLQADGLLDDRPARDHRDRGGHRARRRPWTSPSRARSNRSRTSMRHVYREEAPQ